MRLNLSLIEAADKDQRFILEQEAIPPIGLQDSNPGHSFHLFDQISEWAEVES